MGELSSHIPWLSIQRTTQRLRQSCIFNVDLFDINSFYKDQIKLHKYFLMIDALFFKRLNPLIFSKQAFIVLCYVCTITNNWNAFQHWHIFTTRIHIHAFDFQTALKAWPINSVLFNTIHSVTNLHLYLLIEWTYLEIVFKHLCLIYKK